MTADPKHCFKSSPLTGAGPIDAPVTGLIRQSPSDFVVEEHLGFDFSGEGNHAVIQVRKEGLNTLDIVKAISRVSGVPKRDIGFCGLKDRRALTTQWFSVPIEGGRSAQWSRLENEQIEILSISRHSKKLRRGSHRGNRFCIKVRAIDGDLDELEKTLKEIRFEGVPNYFGPQRFGRSNMEKADALFAGRLRRVARSERSILLSAARSFIFNQVLSTRVQDNTWNVLMEGDVAILDGTNSYFLVDEVSAELKTRLSACDIHPSGPLYGLGENPAKARASVLESRIFDQNNGRCEGLEKFGLRFQRRQTRLRVHGLGWKVSDDEVLDVSFYLATGGYATSVLSRVVNTDRDGLA